MKADDRPMPELGDDVKAIYPEPEMQAAILNAFRTGKIQIVQYADEGEDPTVPIEDDRSGDWEAAMLELGRVRNPSLWDRLKAWWRQ